MRLACVVMIWRIRIKETLEHANLHLESSFLRISNLATLCRNSKSTADIVPSSASDPAPVQDPLQQSVLTLQTLAPTNETPGAAATTTTTKT